MPFRRASLIALIAFLLAALALGCAPKKPPEPQWETEARSLLDQAGGYIAKKQYEAATKTVDAFLLRYPKSRHGDRARYLMGEMRLSLKDYQQALSYYKEIIEKYPASPYIIDARYKLGICYFEIKEYDLAIANLADRSKITDQSILKKSAEMLSSAYLIKKNYLLAVRELAYLASTAQHEKLRTGYRDRVRELVDKQLTEDELRALVSVTEYPADIVMLRLTGVLIEQRKYREALNLIREFPVKFPGHPEALRAEMLQADATAKLTAPRYFIGALLPQTGPAAFFGDRVLKGMQLAVHAYNLNDPDNRVELLVRDTQAAPDKAAAAITDLAANGIVAAVGPLLTKEVEAIAPLLEKLQIPVITPAASGPGVPDLSPWIFRNALTNDSQANETVHFAIRRNLKRFVIFHPDDPYGRDLTRLFTKELGAQAEILAAIAYPPEANDFGLYIRKLIEIDLRSRKIAIPEDDQERKKLFLEYAPSFDALYIPGYAERVGLLLPQLAFYNITGITVIGSNNWHSHDLIERAGRHAEGTVFVDGFFPETTDPALKAVIESYRSAYQEEPDILAAQAYDATRMVLDLLKERKDIPAAVKNGLLTYVDYPGLSGATTFAPNGEARKKLFLITVENGKFAPLVE